MASYPPAPRNWLDEPRLEMLRRLAQEGEPTLAALQALSREEAGKPLEAVLHAFRQSTEGDENDVFRFLAACCVCHLLDGSGGYAEKVRATLEEMALSPAKSDLGQAARSMVAAIAYDCCHAAWDPVQAAEMTVVVANMARKARTINRGNPHLVSNNWWSVTHGGSALAAMAAHGNPLPDGSLCDLSEDIAWSMGRIKAFLGHHGDFGIYHEGLGYQMYAMTYWVPAVLAWRRFCGSDLLAEFPNLRKTPLALFGVTVFRHPLEDEHLAEVSGRDSVPARDSAVAAVSVWQDPEHKEISNRPMGSMLSWNDAGQGFAQSAVVPMMLALAAPEHRGALRWMFDRLAGVQGDGRLSPDWGGWFFVLACYPFDIPATEPGGVLPRHFTDNRQGLSVFRQKYRDGDDALLGIYARTTQMGGHQQDDAGSIRLAALGHDWILGGGQARREAQWQSVVTPQGGRTLKPAACGLVLWDEAKPQGGVFGMDLRKPSVAYAERYVAVDWSGACGSPVLLALLDQIDDHQSREWCWNMTFAHDLGFLRHDDGNGFTLSHADGSRLFARFLGAQPKSLETATMPDSDRTFSNGKTVRYPGRPYAVATFPAQPYLGIYALMTVQRGEGSEMKLLSGLDVQVGRYIWERPFGAAVPVAFRPGKSGVLSRYPSGDLPEG